MRNMDDSLNDTGLKDHPDGSKKLDTEAIEDPKLVGLVEKRMANLNLLTGRTKGKNPAVSDLDDDEPTPDDTDDDTDVDDDDDTDDDTDDDDQAASDDDEEDSTPAKKSKEKDEERIPDACIRAAIHNGWSQEEVDEFIKVSPKVAARTFENLRQSTNKASQEWAALGRASRKEETQKQESAAKKDKIEFEGIDLVKLKKESDIDPGVEQVIRGLNTTNETLVDAVNKLMEEKVAPQDTTRVDRAARSYDAAAEAAAEQQINGFFATDSMKGYSKVYGELKFGEVWESLPPAQARSRYAVYQTADELMAGRAMATGQQMDLGEALERAHLLVTENYREEAIRGEIRKTSKKRAKSMLFRPSDGKSKRSSGGGKPKTKNDLESTVTAAIAKCLKA